MQGIPLFKAVADTLDDTFPLFNINTTTLDTCIELWMFTFDLIALSIIPSFALTQGREHASNFSDSHLQISTKWYQKPNTLNATFMVMKQTTLIGFISAEVYKHTITDNYKGTIPPSKSLAMQIKERVFQNCLLPLTRSSFLPLFLWLRINNNKILVQIYSFKYPKSDINNQIPLTTHSWLCNRLCLLVTAFLRFINAWYQKITRAKYLLQKVPQYKCKNGFSKLFHYLYLIWNNFFWRLWYQTILTENNIYGEYVIWD